MTPVSVQQHAAREEPLASSTCPRPRRNVRSWARFAAAIPVVRPRRRRRSGPDRRRRIGVRRDGNQGVGERGPRAGDHRRARRRRRLRRRARRDPIPRRGALADRPAVRDHRGRRRRRTGCPRRSQYGALRTVRRGARPVGWRRDHGDPDGIRVAAAGVVVPVDRNADGEPDTFEGQPILGFDVDDDDVVDGFLRLCSPELDPRVEEHAGYLAIDLRCDSNVDEYLPFDQDRLLSAVDPSAGAAEEDEDEIYASPIITIGLIIMLLALLFALGLFLSQMAIIERPLNRQFVPVIGPPDGAGRAGRRRKGRRSAPSVTRRRAERRRPAHYRDPRRLRQAARRSRRDRTLSPARRGA